MQYNFWQILCPHHTTNAVKLYRNGNAFVALISKIHVSSTAIDFVEIHKESYNITYITTSRGLGRSHFYFVKRSLELVPLLKEVQEGSI